jgi:hypothetical protein
MNRFVSRWVITLTLLCWSFNHLTFSPDLSRGILGQRLTFEAEGACMTMLVTNLAPGYRIDAMVHIGNGVVLLRGYPEIQDANFRESAVTLL